MKVENTFEVHLRLYKRKDSILNFVFLQKKKVKNTVMILLRTTRGLVVFRNKVKSLN